MRSRFLLSYCSPGWLSSLTTDQSRRLRGHFLFPILSILVLSCMRLKNAIMAMAFLALCAAPLPAQTILTAGAANPYKLARTPGGNFLLAESGTGVNDGLVSLLSTFGDRFRLLSGLPSGVAPAGGTLGPTAVADAHTTIYVVIGEGDILGTGATPPQQIPNPNGPNSPIYSSVLRARFTPVPDGIRTGFQLSAADISGLRDGNEITLTNSSEERVQLLLLTDFRDTQPDPGRGVRNSNPFAATIVGTLTSDDLTELGFQGVPVAAGNYFARLNPDSTLGRRLEERSRLYVVDAGMNTVVEITPATGRWRVLSRFLSLTNPLFPGVGGPTSEPVPTGIFARSDGTLLVTVLGGAPFAPGTSKVYSVNATTGAFTPFIEGLTSSTDVMEVGGVTYVLELSSNFRMGTPGRLLRFATPTSTPTVVAGGLIGPTGLAYEPTRNELIVSETFTGLVKRIAVAQ